jgi:putative SOS response-associated peptidase YedK
MPVILDPADYDKWLDHDQQDAEKVQRLLRPFPAERMQLVHQTAKIWKRLNGI